MSAALIALVHAVLGSRQQFSLFGPDPSHALERLTGPASALWLAVFVLPMFLFTPDLAPTRHLAAARGRARRAAGRCWPRCASSATTATRSPT